MNGVHDMGGMDGFGKVEAEPNEPTFHERWEGRVMAMERAKGANGGVPLASPRPARAPPPPAAPPARPPPPPRPPAPAPPPPARPRYLDYSIRIVLGYDL